MSLQCAGPVAALVVTTSVVESAGDVGMNPSQAIVAGNPAITYHDATNHRLKFARNSQADGSGSWYTVNVDGVWTGRWSSLCVADGNPAVAYTERWEDIAGITLRFARCATADGMGAWSVSTVATNVGETVAMAMVDGRPAIAFTSITDQRVIFARNSAADGSGAWTTLTVPDSNNPYYLSMAVVSGKPAIGFSKHLDPKTVHYSVSSTADGSGAWSTMTVASDPTASYMMPWVAEVNGQPAMLIMGGAGPGSPATLRYAVYGGAYGAGAWTLVTPDPAIKPEYIGISLGQLDGRPIICCNDPTKGVCSLRALDADGLSWGASLGIDVNGGPGSQAVVAGRAAVAYYDKVSKDLKWARIDPGPGDADGSDALFEGTGVYATAVQPDGRILVGGDITKVHGVVRHGLARLNRDGTLDGAFNPDVSGVVLCTAVQDDGKILIGGNFLSVGGHPLKNIARLNADGTLDPDFTTTNADQNVYCIAPQPDGRILLGGWFSNLNGAAHHAVARLNPDGGIDGSFAGDAPGGVVISLAVQNDGKIVIAGSLTSVGGVPRRHMARLLADGTVDPDFDPNPDNGVHSVLIQANGSILMGGDFAALQPNKSGPVVARQHLARVLANGSVDVSFDPAPDGMVESMALQADGNILLGGSFANIAGHARSRIARMSIGGIPDDTFKPAADAFVYSLAIQADGGVLAGGAFAAISGAKRNLFARLLNGPAAQSLTVDLSGGSHVQWLRGGTAPETQTVYFDLTTDGGATFTRLGPGTRVAGGWEVSGVSLPGRGSVRARALTNGGIGLGSGGLVEAAVTLGYPAPDALSPSIEGGEVLAAVVQPDGKIVLAGNFSSVGGAPRHNVARLNVDGTLDSGFDPNANGQVGCVLVQTDGRILLGGAFTSLQPNGASIPTSRDRLARVNADGTLDPGFNPGFDGEVFSLALQADGHILVAGWFATVGGVERRGLARLSAAGGLDSFNASLGGSAPAATCVVVQPDQRILIGGYFDSAGGLTRHFLARLETDGSVDTSFDPNPNSYIFSMALQPDGVIVLGGEFTSVGGVARAYMARVDGSGALDAVFDPSPDGWVGGLSLQTDGKILVGGNFTTLRPGGLGPAITRRHIARLNSDGTADTDFDPNADDRVFSVTTQADGKTLMGGSFSVVGGAPRHLLVRLSAEPATQSLSVSSGSRVQWLRGGTSPEALDVMFELSTDGGATYGLLAPGTRLAGGWECTGLSLPRSGWIRARARTSAGWFGGSSGIVEAVTEFAIPSGGADGLDLAIEGLRVWTMAVQPDGKTVIGGEFTSVLGVARNNIARINVDGSLDMTFDPNVTGGPAVYSLVVQPDGKIVMGGYFALVGGVYRLHLARVNADGSLDASYDPHPENPVYCMAACPDGKLLIGGAFSTVGGAARVHLARLEISGSADPGFVPPGPNNYVTSLALQPDGDVLFGGYFTTVGVAARNNLARVSSSGSLDPAFDPNVDGSAVSALAVQADGKILLGGTFASVGAEARSHLARIHPDGTPDLTFDPTPNNSVYGLAVQTDGRILVTGSFTTFQPGRVGPEIARHHVARLTSEGAVDPMFDPDANAVVYGTAMQADGKVQIGGEFTDVGPAPCRFFARLENDPASQELTNSDRTRVQWLRGGASPETQVVSFELSTDGGASYTLLGQGSRIAGGWELTGLSLPDSGLIRARARTTGGLRCAAGGLVETVVAVRATVDGLDPAMVGGWVNVTAVQPDGGVVIAGWFTSVLGVPRRNVARIKPDGTLDMGFDPSPNAIVSCAAVLADGRVLLGGDFTEIQPNGSPTPEVMAHLVMLNPDGTADYSFGVSGFPPNPDGGVACVTVQPDGKILLGGSFHSISGEVHPALARLNPDGSADAFDAGIIGDLNLVTSLVLQPDGRIVIGGYFTSVGGQPRNHLARVEADGSLDAGFHPNPDGYVLSLALQADGKILAGGQYAFMNGAFRRNLARLQPDGLLDVTFKPEPDDTVWTLAVQADGRILLGGSFTTLQPGGLIPAVPRQHLARLRTDGSLDPDFSNPAVDADVGCLAIRADGKVWLGGGFTTVDGLPRRLLALLGNGPATGVLTKTSASRLDWSRGGTAPEASDVTFELSTDGGASYVLLGHAIRTAGGWQRTGLSLADSGLIRARARVTGSAAGGTSGLVETVFDLSPPAIKPFAEWIADRLPHASAADRAFSADPDHDGLSNGIEYYFGLDPAASGIASLNPVASATGLTLTYTRAVGLAVFDATAVRWSTDLATWSGSGVITTVVGPAGPDHETVSAFVPAAAGGRMFVRIEVGQ